MAEEGSWSDCVFKYIEIICRAIGIIVCLSLWGISVNLLTSTQFKFFAGWYILGIAICVTVLEILWIIDLAPCIPEGGCCGKCWTCLMWIDDWRKTIIYILLTVPLFWQPSIGYTVVLIAIILIFFLAICYAVKSFDRRDVPRHQSKRRDKPDDPDESYQPYTKLTESVSGKEVAVYKSTEDVVMPDPGPQKKTMH